MSDYKQTLMAQLELNRKKINKARSLTAFKEGVPDILDVVSDEISKRVDSMTAKSPLSYEDYLDAHGAVRALRDFNDILTSSEAKAASIEPVIKTQEDQLKQVK